MPIPVDAIRLNYSSSSIMLLNVILGLIMFGIALDTRAEDFRRVLKMPKAMAAGIAAQFLILPPATFLLTLLLHPQPSIALGMLLVACCPPGNISNVLTHRAKANVALSVSMTAVSNLLSIVLMPLNFGFWASIHPTAAPILKQIVLNPADMVLHILLIIAVPFLLGITLANRAPRLVARVKRPVHTGSLLFLVAFIVAAIAGNFQYFLPTLNLVLLAVFLQDAFAFAIGYGCAALFKLEEDDRRAIGFEVGIRNSGLGLGMIFSFFGGLGGMAIVAGVWGFWDIIAGLALAQWWRSRPSQQPTPAVQGTWIENEE